MKKILARAVEEFGETPPAAEAVAAPAGPRAGMTTSHDFVMFRICLGAAL